MRSPSVPSRGFTLIELMIGITLGLLVLAAATAMFVSTSNNRREMERTGRQIENGRYAMQLISNDLANAGYFADFDPRDVGAPAAMPDPCSTDVALLKSAVLLHVQGYGPDDDKPACLADVRARTSALVVRRVATCAAGSADCDPVTPGDIYFQSSLCNAELANPVIATHYVVDAPPTSGPSPFTLKKRDCATSASLRKYVVHVYYIANNGNAGDGVPTLKRAQLAQGAIATAPLVEGIENLQIEYGVDTDGDGIPNSILGVDETPSVLGDWVSVVTANLYVMARATEPSAGYTDAKTYQLGVRSDLSPYTVVLDADAKRYKHHVYSSTVRINNPAGRRE